VTEIDRDTLRADLASSLHGCAEPGHWAFYDYWGNEIGHSLERINVPTMYERRDKWAELAARALLAQPSAIVVISYARSVDWVPSIKAALERGGARLSVTGIALTGEVLSGNDWSASPPAQPVTILNDICTLGTASCGCVAVCGSAASRSHAFTRSSTVDPCCRSSTKSYRIGRVFIFRRRSPIRHRALPASEAKRSAHCAPDRDAGS